ncbi:hypothetical protein AMTRI_Chr02g258520 [Amborella trichopoda]|uniref:Ankyrin repeat domain-containing protein n=1 Tax=Amborella trichopoda TaxID=13333 RepID=U5CVL8_AMBTC|nr:ankyrin repeat domain-containing protein 13C [Amborella trichopoda]ERN17371.1 hypothetical protein AMTR_s00037p00173970 [Amborella trichopoda]|eukprot:XP_020530098.1 ankyrin repeat domain-containing protein 13C [Amborella trichopoda]
MMLRPDDYAHSPAHYAVALGDHSRLSRLISRLPRLREPAAIRTEDDSLAEERVADSISAVVDRRDGIPSRDTPLHLAVRLADPVSVRMLLNAGADPCLHNAAGWSALHDAVCCHRPIAALIQRHLPVAAWSKWCRRLPRLIATLRRMRDFYMEISFRFESSLVPFVARLAPSDTYRLWKRGADLRADLSLTGFDGLRFQRSPQTFLFLGDSPSAYNLPEGSLLVLSHDDEDIIDTFENAGAPLPNDEGPFRPPSSVFRPGMDVTAAELVGRLNWRRQEKIEMVGEWRSRVYEVHNVLFSIKTRKVDEDVDPLLDSLELDEDEDGFLVAENPCLSGAQRRSSFEKADLHSLPSSRRNSSFEKADLHSLPSSRRNSSFEVAMFSREDKEWVSSSSSRRNSSFEVGHFSREDKEWVAHMRRKGLKEEGEGRMSFSGVSRKSMEKKGEMRESEYKKGLRPLVWLTDQFPLKTEELLPLLDILANKVKAVRRLRELLTTKLPPATFPVKVAIPVVPTVRVVVTFTKFEDLQGSDRYFTPLSSPRLLQCIEEEEEEKKEAWGPRSQWVKWGAKDHGTSNSKHSWSHGPEEEDPFAIPAHYQWTTMDSKRNLMKEKKSKSRKAK